MKDLLAHQLQDYFIEHDLTLSVAESCTGGSLAARLTKVPGCSKYFTGAVVSYSNALKLSLLSVDPLILAEKGAVSGPIAQQMAEGILRLTGSHYSLAVTGIAGPGGGMDSKPIGTIWAAVGKRSNPPYIWNFHVNGSREEIIQLSVEIVLSKLWTLLTSNV